MCLEQLTSVSTNALRHPTLSRSVRLRTAAAVGLLCFSTSQGAFAQVACDSRIYISQGAAASNTTLNYSNGSLPLSFSAQGTAGVTYNALGMSPTGYLYAMLDTSNQLLQINPTNGSASAPVAVSGLPSVYYNSGAFSAAGTYYVKPSGSTSVIYAIDVGTSTATAIPLVDASSNPISFPASDMAWASGGLYAVGDGGQLRAINTVTGVVTAIGSPDLTGGVLGAQFGFTNGLYGAANDGSGYYQINLTTGQRTLLSAAPPAASNDGANCPTASFGPTVTPEPKPPVSVPTLGEWALILLAGLLGVVGMVGARRRSVP